MQDTPRAVLQFLHGHKDGVAPTVLLRLNRREQGIATRAEYIFGAGEGVSRAFLEHKVRPSGDLKAIVSSTLSGSSIGGLAGLLLRLKADGHGKVHAQSAQ